MLQQERVLVVASYNLTAAEVKQSERLYLVSGKLLGDKRIDLTQLCVVEFVPPLRYIEIYRNGIHKTKFFANVQHTADLRKDSKRLPMWEPLCYPDFG